MWKENRFVATRDPSRGGLQISATTPDFESKVGKEIYDNFLELISQDFDHPCTAIYPLKDGRYVVCMAQKVASSKRESRVHDMIRGVIAMPEELELLCTQYLFCDCQSEIFFPERQINPDDSGLWSLPEKETCRKEPFMERYMNELDFRQTLGLYYAMNEIAKRKFKVQLVVPTGEESQTLAVCASAAAVAGARLFMTANGECTLKSPDIVILDEMKYQNRKSYSKMTLQALMQMGRSMVRTEAMAKDEENPDQSDIMVENLLNLCEAYLGDREDLEPELYEAVGELMSEDSMGYQRWKRKLRRELSYCTKTERFTKRYMKLLYLAFRKESEYGQCFTPEIQTAPYDFAEMYSFLKKKATSTRELKRLAMLLLEVQFEDCAGFFDKKIVHESAKRCVAGK